jgi:predicted acylesterase/phospholipase RssA
MFVPPYRISLSGGGIKGFAHIGALEVLEAKDLLKTVREYVGISAGAFCALGMCIGCSIFEMRELVMRMDFQSIQHIDPETVLNFPETYGIDNGLNLEKLLAAVLKAKHVAPNITFAQLEAMRIGPNLRVFATNITKCIPQEFSAALTPDIEVCVAVRASMSVPIYFTPVKIFGTGDLFLDGGISNPSPFPHLKYSQQIHTLAIVFGDDHKQAENIDNIYDFLYQVCYSLDYLDVVRYKAKWAANTIKIQCGRVNSIEFGAGLELKNRLINAGRRAAEEFLKSPGQRPVRRFSVA